MAKRIRFPLKLAQGAEVRTLEELREHFDLEAILEYYKNGKLLTWLEDRYLEGEAEAVQALDAAAPDFQKQLCEVFQVEYTGSDLDLEEIERRQERLKRLRTITDEAEFIENIDRVAFDQEELADLLDEGANKIYLCGERFTVPASRTGVTYVGIKNPAVHISGNVPKTLEQLEIEFVEITCDNLPKCSEQKISEMISRTSRFVVLEHYYLYNYSSETSQFYRYEIATGEEEPLPSDLVPVLGDFGEWVCAGDQIAYLRNGILCSINIHLLTKKDYPDLEIYGRQFAFSKNYIAVRTTDNFVINIYNRQGQGLHRITSPLHENRLMLDGEVINREYKLPNKSSIYDSSEIQIFGNILFFKIDSSWGPDLSSNFGYLNLDTSIPECKFLDIDRANISIITMVNGLVYLKGPAGRFNTDNVYFTADLRTGTIKRIWEIVGKNSILVQSSDYLVCWMQNDKNSLLTIELSTGKVKKIPYAVKNSSQLDSVRFLLLDSTLYCINKSDSTNCKFDLSLLVPEASGAIPTAQSEKYSSASEAENAATPQKKFFCPVCGYVHEGDGTGIKTCPTCRAPFSKFIEMKPDKKKKSVCPVCGYVNNINARFCPQCGAHMPH